MGTPNLSQAIRIKKLQENGVFSKEKIEELLSEIKQKDIDRVVFKMSSYTGISHPITLLNR